MDAPFIFNETTADFQAVTVQGHLTYRVADPMQLAALLDYSVRPDGATNRTTPTSCRCAVTHAAQNACVPRSRAGRCGPPWSKADAIAGRCGRS